MLRTVLYIVWALLPAFFFVMALYAKLEQLGGSVRKQNPGDFFRQGCFVGVCVLLTILIDRYVLESFVRWVSSSWLPLPFVQIILLPVVLFTAARLFGGSKEILIGKAPTPSKRFKGQKRS